MRPSNSDRPSNWESIKLGQIRRLIQLGELGRLQDFKKIFGIDPTTVSRDLSALQEHLGIGELTETVHHERRLNQAGKLLAQHLEPALKFLERFVAHEIPEGRPRVFRMGAGGSLVGWLIGSRIASIKKALRPEGREDEPTSDCELKMDIQSYKNREIVLQVASGALDCGLVRSGVAEDKRLGLCFQPLGDIRYFLYVPDKWITYDLPVQSPFDPLPPSIEKQILLQNPIATVGPEGEFPMRLKVALEDADISANIEFSYRAFPQLLAHMMLQSHVTIMPDVHQLQGIEIPGYRKFPFGLLRHYRRSIYFIYHRDHKERTPWINMETLAEVLKFKSDTQS